MANPLAYPTATVNNSYLVELIQYANDVTMGFLGVVILILVGSIAFLSAKSFSTSKGLAFGAFLSFITAIFLRFLELINDGVLIGAILVTAGALVLLIKEGDPVV